MAKTIESLKAEIAYLKKCLETQQLAHRLQLNHLPSADAINEAWREGFKAGFVKRDS